MKEWEERLNLFMTLAVSTKCVASRLWRKVFYGIAYLGQWDNERPLSRSGEKRRNAADKKETRS